MNLSNKTELECRPALFSDTGAKDEDAAWREARVTIIIGLDAVILLRNDKPLNYIQELLESRLKDSDVSNREDYKEKLEWNAKIIYEYKANHKNICPGCGHVNSGSAHYCVMCGKLLMFTTKKMVVDQSVFDELCRRPDISQHEYDGLKRRAEMSVGGHIRSYLSQKSDEWILPITLFCGTLIIGFLIAWFMGDFDNKETPVIEICKSEKGYGLRMVDSGLPVLGANYDSIVKRNGYYAYYKDSLMGITSFSGTVLTPCIYKRAQNSLSEIMWVEHEDGYYDLINSMGEQITNGHYDWVSWDSEEDKNGEIVKRKFATVVGYYTNSKSPKAPKNTPNYAIVGVNGKFIQKDCFWIYDYSQGLAAVRPTYKDSIVYVDIEGNVVFPIRHGSSEEPRFYELFSFRKDENGYNVNPSFKNDTARIMINGEKCYLFRDGKYVRAGEEAR